MIWEDFVERNSWKFLVGIKFEKWENLAARAKLVLGNH
jgi:hypothetical protein